MGWKRGVLRHPSLSTTASGAVAASSTAPANKTNQCAKQFPPPERTSHSRKVVAGEERSVGVKWRRDRKSLRRRPPHPQPCLRTLGQLKFGLFEFKTTVFEAGLGRMEPIRLPFKEHLFHYWKNWCSGECGLRSTSEPSVFVPLSPKHCQNDYVANSSFSPPLFPTFTVRRRRFPGDIKVAKEPL